MTTNFQDFVLNDARPTPVRATYVDVAIDPEIMVDAYANAFYNEIERVHPRLIEKYSLTSEQLIRYCRFLLEQRVAQVLRQRTDWQALKQLWIPVFIQYSMSLIGEVVLRDKGLILRPVIVPTSEMTTEEAIQISYVLSLAQRQLQMVDDAMPRDIKGDQDTMSCALIAGYVRSVDEVEHPISTYIAAFMGFKLQEEAAFKVLYRVEYDDVDYIRHSLIHDRVVMGHAD